MNASKTIDVAPGCPSNLELATNAGAIDPSPFVQRLQSGVSRLELAIHGARCGACISKIEGGIGKIPGIDAVRLNLSTGKLSVSWRGGSVAPHEITKKVAELGYRAAAFDPRAMKSGQYDDLDGAAERVLIDDDLDDDDNN